MKGKKFLLAAAAAAAAMTIAKSVVKAAETGSMNLYGICLEESGKVEIMDGEDEFGDAVLVESGGAYLLMDVGSEATSDSLVKYLKSVGVEKLDVYISHTHLDHRGGLGAVCDNFEVGKIYLPDTSIGKDYVESTTGATAAMVYSNLLAAAEAEGAEVVYLKKGSSFSVGSVDAEVLGPVGSYTMKQFASQAGESGSQSGHYLNNYSLTTMMTCGSVKFLATGDIEKQEEENLVKTYGSKLKADILKMPHHGLPTSNTEGFAKAVAPVWSFAENMGYTDNTTVKKEGKTVIVPKTYTPQSTMQQYGMTYMVGSEGKALIMQVADGKVSLYRDSDNDGKAAAKELLTGWVSVKGILQGKKGSFDDDSRFYLGEDGKPKTGVLKVGKDYYYMGTGGAMERAFYNKTGGKYVYHRYRDYGTAKNPRYRYFEEDGRMSVGICTVVLPSGQKGLCYFEKDGLRHVGKLNFTDIVQVDGKRYAVDENGGVYTNLGKGGLLFNDDRTRYRYFDKNGVMAEGFMNFDGKITCFEEITGYNVDGLVNVKGKVYYLQNGALTKKGTKVINGTKCKFDKKGVMTSPKISAPTSVKASPNGVGSNKITWKKVKGAAGYTIYRSSKKNGTYYAIGTVNKGSATSYKDKNADSGATYYYKVASCRKIGAYRPQSGYSSAAKAKTK